MEKVFFLALSLQRVHGVQQMEAIIRCLLACLLTLSYYSSFLFRLFNYIGI